MRIPKRIKVSMHLLDRLWGSLLAFAMILMVREAAMGAEAAVNPQVVYHKAWTEIGRDYVDPGFNGQDWTVWEHKFDGKLNSMDEAKTAIKEMAASLGDHYTRMASVAPEGPQASHGETPVAEPKNLTSRMEAGVGYIKIPTFASPTVVQDFKNSLERLESARKLVLDLRGNRGGSVTNALEIADMLLDHGDIMTTVSRDGTKRTYSASGQALTSQPLVVLVDQNSASASEILTAALHDNQRATVVGTKTFGKGLIQEVTALPEGVVLYVTNAHYLTPSGKNINKIGIEPDAPESKLADILLP